MTHDVTVHTDHGRRWWQCTCGWRGEPYIYDDPARPAEAIRHTIQGNREDP